MVAIIFHEHKEDNQKELGFCETYMLSVSHVYRDDILNGEWSLKKANIMDDLQLTLSS